jgi:hypothetical protein
MAGCLEISSKLKEQTMKNYCLIIFIFVAVCSCSKNSENSNLPFEINNEKYLIEYNPDNTREVLVETFGNEYYESRFQNSERQILPCLRPAFFCPKCSPDNQSGCAFGLQTAGKSTAILGTDSFETGSIVNTQMMFVDSLNEGLDSRKRLRSRVGPETAGYLLLSL